MFGFMKNVLVALFVGAILGYIYGYGAYNRPIRRWEFWLKN